jgi:hypothetical protein
VSETESFVEKGNEMRDCVLSQWIIVLSHMKLINVNWLIMLVVFGGIIIIIIIDNELTDCFCKQFQYCHY